MVRSIVVPLDGSPFGEHALPLALGLARRTGAALQLVHVYAPAAVLYPEQGVVFEEELAAAFKTRQRAYLDGLAERLTAAGAVPAHATLLEGEVADGISRHAAANQADLIVLTTHARGPVARLWLGSVADRLIREAPVPVLLVRPAEQPAAVTREASVRHVLIPLDGSPLAEQILEPALALGRRMGAAVTLFRAVRQLEPPLPLREGPDALLSSRKLMEQVEEVEARLCREAQTYLDRVADRLRKGGAQVQTQVALATQPAVAILQARADPPVDLIAMQTHGRSGLSRLLLGSVADKVLRGAAVPLLVHHPVAG